jgi:hypothetical protein
MPSGEQELDERQDAHAQRGHRQNQVPRRSRTFAQERRNDQANCRDEDGFEC